MLANKSGLQPAPNVPNPRNAGRKKSNPVWEFFTDLRCHGLAGVRCRFCHWVTNDRSPTTMKFHLKRKHDTGVGGLWAICEEKINSQAPANYAPRTKKFQSDDALLKALSQPNFNANPFTNFINNTINNENLKMNMSTPADDFLQSLIQQAQTLAGNIQTPPEMSENIPLNDNEHGLSISDTLFLSKLNESVSCSNKEEDGSSSSVSGQISSNPSDFSLSDGTSISALLQIASDTELAFSFNSRQTAEYCFSSNQRGGRSVVFSDFGPEVRVSQRMGDEDMSVETWKKSDWNQFCWAVRGACVHFLKS